MIQQQIETRLTPLWKCVEDFRTRKTDPHRPVVVDIGIDQEGHLIGVTAASTVGKKKADVDPELGTCMTSSLKGLLFPRSHAGVISVRQTFKDEAVTR